MIAGIEKIHGDRFGYYLNLMEQNKLFVSEVKCGWICLNCGYIKYPDNISLYFLLKFFLKIKS